MPGPSASPGSPARLRGCGPRWRYRGPAAGYKLGTLRVDMEAESLQSANNPGGCRAQAEPRPGGTERENKITGAEDSRRHVALRGVVLPRC